MAATSCFRARPTTWSRATATALPTSFASTASPAAGSGQPLDTGDLHAWLDGLLPYALKTGDIAGVVIAVVKDGSVILQEGYGYADVGKRIPMDPERTMVRPGSTAKLFTWTAVMQLVEQGKITPVVTKTYPFEQANEALKDLSEQKSLGRTVLTFY